MNDKTHTGNVSFFICETIRVTKSFCVSHFKLCHGSLGMAETQYSKVQYSRAACCDLQSEGIVYITSVFHFLQYLLL